MSKIERFTIGKGTTRKVSEMEYDRKFLQLEIRLPEQFTEEGFHEALMRAEYLIDSFLGQPSVPQIPQLDIAEVQSLPWVSYQTKQPCTKPDESGWVFRDSSRHTEEKQKTISELASAIEKAPKNKLELGDTVYTFSGPKEDAKLFISRRPIGKK